MTAKTENQTENQNQNQNPGALWSEAVKAAAKAARDSGGYLPGRFLPDADPLIAAAAPNAPILSAAAALPPSATRKERAAAEKCDTLKCKAADAILVAIAAGSSVSSILAEVIRENAARAETVTQARAFAVAIDTARAIRKAD
jgi:hypothetical protein